MNDGVLLQGQVIDYEDHWASSVDTYRSHPTSRHRRRFILNRLRQIRPRPGQLVFDYGCGAGILLEEIASTLELREDDLGGCDISHAGIASARRRLPGSTFLADGFPRLDREIDVAITSEVIEHTGDYRRILEWMIESLSPTGHIIVTTPGGTMDPPDEYYGHVQHFKLDELAGLLRELGCRIVSARYWGYPFFTLQKWVTRRNFDRVRESYMHGELDLKKKLIFTSCYYAYLLHDLIPRGPQIFIHARRDSLANV